MIAVVEKGIVTSAIHNSTEKILKWVDESDGRTDCVFYYGVHSAGIRGGP